MIGDERDNLRVNAWIRGGKKNGFFVRPRLFMPYYEEIKVIIIIKILIKKIRNILMIMEYTNEYYIYSILVLGRRTNDSRS